MQITVSGWMNQFHRVLQGVLFPTLEQELGPLTDNQRQLVRVLSLISVDSLVSGWDGGVGRPARYRRALARSFVAKAVYNLGHTRQLLERLGSDDVLRRLCGWESVGELLHESQFSRAFAEFSSSELPQRLHAALIAATQKERLVGHISRDATEIDARERPVRTPLAEVQDKPARKPGRAKKGEQPAPREPTRLERQKTMTLERMLADLPRDCAVGTKKNSKGYQQSWTGYKLHLDVADGQIPISCILTSASLHDSQAAVPLALTTAQRVTNLYDLSDAAYDAPAIHERIRGLGRIPLIAPNPRRDAARKQELEAEQKRCKLLNLESAEQRRFRERTTVERVNARLKDEFGGRTVRVRGHAKVMCHLMFGILALAADQILRQFPAT